MQREIKITCVVCTGETGLTVEDLQTCNQVCSEECNEIYLADSKKPARSIGSIHTNPELLKEKA